ncbi:DsbA family protein [Nocardia sp. NPDC057668]|uniref:DsbA family protein n=1 Tax=Nocardia sp. NPDC057668 TaxID=3346202 RepID=UPI00366CA642
MSKKPADRKNPLADAQRSERNRKIMIQVGVAAVLVGLVAAIGIGLAMRDSKDGSDFNPVVTHDAAAGAVPPNVTEGGAIRIGKPDAKAKIQIVADLQCPACKGFEQTNASVLDDALSSGDARIEYSIISFLDRASQGNQYSTRAANAAYVVASADTANFQKWLELMFAKQPAEGANGMTDDQLIAIAAEAGYTDPAVAQGIRDGKYIAYVKDATKAVFDTGLDSTPTVYVNGKKVNPQSLKSEIEAAAK